MGENEENTVLLAEVGEEGPLDPLWLGPLSSGVNVTPAFCFTEDGKLWAAWINRDGGRHRLIVREAQAGVVIDAGDPAKLAECIRDLAAAPADARRSLGRRGRRYLTEHFERSRVIGSYETILHEVFSSSASGRNDASHGL